MASSTTIAHRLLIETQAMRWKNDVGYYCRNLVTPAILRLLGGVYVGAAPWISVLIVTRNHATFLNLTLTTLRQQFFPENLWEVVVVDDASQDDTVEVLARHTALGLPLVCCRNTVPEGYAVSANIGLAASRSRVVVFLNQTSLVLSDFILRHAMHHHRGSLIVYGDNELYAHTHLLPLSDAVMAGAVPLPVVSPETLSQKDWLRQLAGYQTPKARPVRRTEKQDYAWLGRHWEGMSVLRSTLCAVKGFDEDVVRWRLEDWELDKSELVLRLLQGGNNLYHDSKAYVINQQRQTQWGSYDLRQRTLHFLATKHPALDQEVMKEMLLPEYMPGSDLT